MNNFQINPAKLSDIITFSKLAHEIWHEHYPQIITVNQIDYMLTTRYTSEILEKEFHNKNIFWFVLECEGEPAGFLSYHHQEDKIFLAKLYTLKKFRGIGLGKAAVEFVKVKAIESGILSFYLYVSKKNEIAIKSYQLSGLEITEALVTDIGNGYVADDYRMEKKLI